MKGGAILAFIIFLIVFLILLGLILWGWNCNGNGRNGRNCGRRSSSSSACCLPKCKSPCSPCPPKCFGFSNVLIVDGVTGNDATGSAGGCPFATVGAALAAAKAGQTVWVLPGTYPEYSLTVPNGVALRGFNQNGQTPILGSGLGPIAQGVVIGLSNATDAQAQFPILTVAGAQSLVSDLTVQLITSSVQSQIAGMTVILPANSNAFVQNVNVRVDNSGNTTAANKVAGIQILGSEAGTSVVFTDVNTQVSVNPAQGWTGIGVLTGLFNGTANTNPVTVYWNDSVVNSVGPSVNANGAALTQFLQPLTTFNGGSFGIVVFPNSFFSTNGGSVFGSYSDVLSPGSSPFVNGSLELDGTSLFHGTTGNAGLLSKLPLEVISFGARGLNSLTTSGSNVAIMNATANGTTSAFAPVGTLSVVKGASAGGVSIDMPIAFPTDSSTYVSSVYGATAVNLTAFANWSSGSATDATVLFTLVTAGTDNIILGTALTASVIETASTPIISSGISVAVAPNSFLGLSVQLNGGATSGTLSGTASLTTFGATVTLY